MNSVSDIPILAYHKVAPDTEFGLTTIAPAAFLSQMKHLHNSGYRTVTFRDLERHDLDLPEKPFILTFDDGYECIYQNALPVMETCGFHSVTFIVTGYIGKKNDWEAFRIQRQHRHLSSAQIKELSRLGHEIGSHTVTHPFLTALPDKKALAEISDSAGVLSELTGDAVRSFCYPYGKYAPRTARLLKQCGYRYATVNRGIFNVAGGDNFRLPRAGIYSTDSLRSFSAKIHAFKGFNIPRLSEWIIRKGALAGIARKSIGQILSNAEDLF